MVMKKFKDYSIAVLIVVVALALAGCGGGSGTPASGSSGTMAIDAIAFPLPSTLPVTGVVTSSAANQPYPAANAAINNGWDTVKSLAIPNLTLIAQLNSSGSNAWSYAAHPNVYIASTGPGYSGLLSSQWVPATRTFASSTVNATAQAATGVVIIDSYTKAVVASASYPDTGPSKGTAVYDEPMGCAVSQNGAWIYIQGNNSTAIPAATLSYYNTALNPQIKTLPNNDV